MKETTVIGKNAIVHTIRHSEELAFSKWINQYLYKNISLFLLFEFYFNKLKF